MKGSFYSYVGVITGFRTLKKPVLYSNNMKFIFLGLIYNILCHGRCSAFTQINHFFSYLFRFDQVSEALENF